MTPEAVLSALSNHALLRFDGSNWHLTSPREQVPTAVVGELLQQKLLELYERSSSGTFYRLRKPMDHSLFALVESLAGKPDIAQMCNTSCPFVPPTSAVSWSQREILYGLYIDNCCRISASEIIYLERFWRNGWIEFYSGTGGALLWYLTPAMREFIMADLQKKVAPVRIEQDDAINLAELDL